MGIKKRNKSVLNGKKGLLLIVIAIVLSVAVTGCLPSKNSSVSNVGGADKPQKVSVKKLPISSVGELELRCPHFFNLSTDGGLTVHIWQTAENDYRCYLINSFTDAITDNSFAYVGGTTIAEMRAILSTYDIKKENITITPVENPLSSYSYKINNKYREKVNELFWQDNNVFYTTVSEVFGADQNELFSNALNFNKSENKEPYHLPVYKFDTLKDLEDFKLEFSDKIDMNRSWHDDAPSFNDATAKYNNDFFQKNSLVLVYLCANSGSLRYDVKSIEYTPRSFLVHVEQIPYEGDVTCDISEWFIAVAVSDKLIKNCTEFDADLDNANTKPEIEELKQKFPKYFSLDASNGLEIYLWNTTRTHIYCGLLPTKSNGYAETELTSLSEASATMEEMREIAQYYIDKGYVTKDKVTVKLINMPHTTFSYTDESYRKHLEDIFWK